MKIAMMCLLFFGSCAFACPDLTAKGYTCKDLDSGTVFNADAPTQSINSNGDTVYKFGNESLVVDGKVITTEKNGITTSFYAVCDGNELITQTIASGILTQGMETANAETRIKNDENGYIQNSRQTFYKAGSSRTQMQNYKCDRVP